MIYMRLKYYKNKKHLHTEKLCGCSIEELKQHIEKQFKSGMTWDNHGRGEDYWHIDHIRPVSSFNLCDTEEQKKCFHYINLQPLWEKENFSKGAAYV